MKKALIIFVVLFVLTLAIPFLSKIPVEDKGASKATGNEIVRIFQDE